MTENSERIATRADVLEALDTMFGPQIDAQAWSQGDSSPPIAPPDRHSWWRVGGLAAIVVLVAVTVTGLIMATIREEPRADAWPVGYTNPPTPQMPTDTPEPPPPAWPPPAVPDAALITDDGQYLQLLNRDHLAPLYGQADTIRYAHWECSELRSGVSSSVLLMYEMSQVPPGDSRITIAGVRNEINDAIAAYCPEEAGR